MPEEFNISGRKNHYDINSIMSLLTLITILIIGISIWYTDFFCSVIFGMSLIIGFILILIMLFIMFVFGIIKLFIKKFFFTRWTMVTFFLITMLYSLYIISVFPDGIQESRVWHFRTGLCLLDEKECNKGPDVINLRKYNKFIGSKKALAENLINKILLLKHSYHILHSDLTASHPFFSVDNGYGITLKFIIEKAEGKCGANSTDDPDKANCVILIDINGDKLPNQISTGNPKQGYSFKDQYRIIINGENAHPAVNKSNDVALQALNMANRDEELYD